MTERADAVRNRQALLDAAGRLFDAADDPAAVSMDDVARAAGVGKGTVFRRFGDRTSLLRAVYDTRLADLSSRIESGPAPLGPGGPQRRRIAAILAAIVDFKLDNRQLAIALERNQSASSPTLYLSPSYRDTHVLLSGLLAEVAGAVEADWLAYALLAVTRIDLVDHLIANEGVSRSRLHADLRRYVDRVLN